MAILKCRSGEVEVQLRKPRIEDDVPNYFEEFENVRASIGSTSANRCTKYIISEDTSYAVEVTLKKGFDFGEAEGVRVKLYDKASDNFIGQKAIDKGNVAKLADDHTVLIETVSGGIFDGHWVKDAELMFKALSMDERLDKETDVPGVSVADLGGLCIRVYKYAGMEEVTLSQQEYDKRLARFQGQQISRPMKIDESSFNKDGITHTIQMYGGSWAGNLGPPRLKHMFRKETDKVVFEFVCRSKEFLEKSSFMKCPLPLELLPWACLTLQQRLAAFKILQDHDKEDSLASKVTEAGLSPDIKAIKEELFGKTTISKRWKPYLRLQEREKKTIFIELQHRRLDFEERKVPPVAKPVGIVLNSDQNGGINIIQTNIPDSTGRAQVLDLSVEQEPVRRPSTPNNPHAEPEYIIIDDTPPRSSQRDQPVGNLAGQIGTQAVPIDLDTYIFQDPRTSSIPSRIKPEMEDNRASKRAKLDPVVGNQAGGAAEIRRLRLELQRRKQELEAADNLARLRREAEELETKIEDLEEAKEEEKSGAASQPVLSM